MQHEPEAIADSPQGEPPCTSVPDSPRPPLRIRSLEAALPLAVALLLAAAGQMLLSAGSHDIPRGLLLYVAAAILFIALTVEPRARSTASPTNGPRLWWRLAVRIGGAVAQDPSRGVLYALALFGAVAVIQEVRTLPAGSNHYPALVVWIAAILALAAATLRQSSSGPSAGADGNTVSWSRDRVEIACVLSLLAVAFLLRYVSLADLPANFGGDEGSQGLSSQAFLEGRAQNVFGTGWFSVPNLFFLMQAVSLKLFGDSVFGLRMFSVLIGVCTVAFTYLLSRQLFGVRLALASAALLATYHFHIHYSRLGSHQIGDSLLVVGTFYLLLKGMKTGRPVWFVSAGAFLGLTQYFYFGARLVPALVLVYLAYLAAAHRSRLVRCWRGLAAMALMAGLVAIPYLSWVSVHPHLYMERANQVSIFASGWLEREPAITGKDTLTILTEQALRSLLSFNHYPDKTYWYHPGVPLLDSFASVFLVLGLAYSTWRIMDRRYFLVSAVFWLWLFFGAFMTENPPSSMRLVGLAPIVAILVSVGMLKTVEMIGSAVEVSLPRWRDFALAGLIAIAAASSVSFYFIDYSQQRTEGYGGPNTEVATELALYLREIGTDHYMFFFGPPRMYMDFSTIPFIARGVQGSDVLEPIETVAELDSPATRNVFIFLPERLGEMDVVRLHVPSGVIDQVRSREGGQLLFVAYRVDLPLQR